MDERILISLAVAAVDWSRHLDGDALPGKVLMGSLGLAAAEVSRWRAEAGDAHPLRPADLVHCMARPLAEWLPEGPEECLLEEGGPSAWAQAWAELQGGDPILEAEQRVILKAMQALEIRSDGEARYTELRDFLIHHALALESDARAMLAPLGLPLSDFYQALGDSCLLRVAGEEVCFPCPRCGWPMVIQHKSGQVRCRAEACVSEGARFRWHDGTLLPVGNRTRPARVVPAAGWVRLTTGLWRYAVLPGLWERELADRLRRLPGVEVALWPHLDLYDLDVRFADRQWRVDVKDHRSPRRLAELLARRPPPSRPTYIVIPDTHGADLAVLLRLCGDESSWRFETCRSFVERVRREIAS